MGVLTTNPPRVEPERETPFIRRLPEGDPFKFYRGRVIPYHDEISHVAHDLGSFLNDQIKPYNLPCEGIG